LKTAVSQEVIDGFAKLTGDRKWIHVEVERARRESPFVVEIDNQAKPALAAEWLVRIYF
jgi:hypothetical protein